MKRDAATERQVQAAYPGNSTWLSANAGSGKTRVLTDRVARLLLGNVQPQHILCLTYTKAAASEMQNRLFRRLGEWAMLDAETLTGKLRELGLEGEIRDETLREARRLFARAIETPGGLKIQTIHSFCASLLRRFPLEAGVSPQFVEMDDRAARRLRADILEDLADGPAPEVFDGIAAWFTGDDLDRLVGDIAKHRDAFPAEPDAGAIWDMLDLPAGYDEDALKGEVFLGGEAELLADLRTALDAGTSTDVKAGEKLRHVDTAVPGKADYESLESVFLFGSGAKEPFSAKIGSFPTKKTREANPDLSSRVEPLMLRIEAARQRRLSLIAARKTLALHRFAAAFLPEYEARKLRHGWLDFDDLILKARNLLTDRSVAEWVLYRLDGGIDHILVDEAQDTSPLQWEVIDLLAQEFTSGQGARDVARTIFVVGDQKQSIYSFQGADPDGFDRMRRHFAERLENVSVSLENLLLEYSFRSSPAILRVVDATFPEHDRAGLGDEVSHLAFRSEMPGRVDLWPLVEKTEKPERPHWTDPVNTLSPEHHSVKLAERVAGEIKAMIDRGETLWENGARRPVTPGDVLILVQRRSDLFHEIIRACKAAGLAIAGADRLKIGGELAVRDLKALLSFLALPEDSLSLATALRSPLFGWDEARLYDLAAGRGEKYLWEALRKRFPAGTEPFGILDALLKDADYLRPFDLLERILTRHDGRRKLIARLGEEAEDGIDALLSQALAYERMEVPSLTGFVTWLETEEVEIKRQLDAAGDRIRVMTVHGSKGLEAPIVILPDTGKRQPPKPGEIVTDAQGRPIWKPAASDSPDAVNEALNQQRTRQEEERQRLLYVAMTRAEQWLITCAAGDLDKGKTWYERIAAGMEHAGAVKHDFGFGQGLRYETGDWGGAAVAAKAPAAPAAVALPDWARARAAVPERPAAALAPSDLGGAKALPGEGDGLDEAAAMRRGTLLHLLLEHLPGTDPAQWDALAPKLLRQAENPPDPAETETLLAEARAVLSAPDLAHVFAPGTLAEVDVSASLPALGGQRIRGAIDRLIVEKDRVLAVDFKSNAVVPARPEEVPDGLMRQMGAYAAALAAVYPGRRIETAILWTRAARLMPLPSALVTAALAHLDGAGAAP
ncbi:double-strand break repair helicase AddA [Actibacterium sp. MT2.3-13A]|uniref:double-strand break repair helicase AddA n=1 Tax=Actibacterium sp. MT2.3-13A TaxID=2828332 RepID=UPI001BA62BFB|nr:double-strand break repair helicase AddA [Actibacterium sp. MT2.3-13A]